MVSDELVKRFADAIAHAEGFYEVRPDGDPNLPQRCNNPGDLTDDGDIGYGTARSKGFGAANITIYPSAIDGWNALYRKIRRALSGSSRTYTLDMSIEQFGWTYARDVKWAPNVAARLGIPLSTTLVDLVAADLKQQGTTDV